MSSLRMLIDVTAERIGENPVDRSGLAVVLGLCAAAGGFGAAVAIVRKGRNSSRRPPRRRGE